MNTTFDDERKEGSSSRNSCSRDLSTAEGQAKIGCAEGKMAATCTKDGLDINPVQETL